MLKPYVFVFALLSAATVSKGQALKGVQKTADEAIPLEKILPGTWDWSWEGSNWGRESVAQKNVLEKQMIIGEDGSIAFYKNDTLVKKGHYKLEPIVPGQYMMTIGDEAFSVWMEWEWNQLYMSEPWCVCGCLTNVYNRKK